VHTVSSASTSVDGRVVYVATAGEEPIALWITDGQDGERALSLTLAPRHVPPREIRVTVPGYRPQGGTRTAAGEGAPPAPLASPADGDGFGAAYVEGLTDLLRAMAQQRLPPGFQVGKAAFKAHCAAHLKVNKTQLTAGPSASVLTLGVRNSGQDPIAITASVCAVEQQVVAAVAAWPLKTVGPGQETEVFLVLPPGAVAASGQPL
jgi:conjugal transfer pilus assembly protein TraK